MANPYFTASGVPTQRSNGVSGVIRQELANIAAAFDKLPAFAGNVGKFVVIGATSLNPSGAMTETGANAAFAGDVSIVGNLTTQGNTALGNAAADTLTVSGALIKSANGNWTLPAAASGDTLNISALAGNFGVVQAQSMAGGTAKWQLRNSSNAASSAAQFSVEVGGTAAGDPVYQAIVTGGSTWTFGIDNDQSDVFKWAAASALGSTAAFAIETGGTIWGSNLHNNATVPTGVTKQVPGMSGSYTPGAGFGGVVTAVTPRAAQWSRTANTVIVSGHISVTTSGAGFAAIDLVIPINSVFVTASNIGGFGGDINGNALSGGMGWAGSANTARLSCSAPGAGTFEFSYFYHYQVLA